MLSSGNSRNEGKTHQQRKSHVLAEGLERVRLLKISVDSSTGIIADSSDVTKGSVLKTITTQLKAKLSAHEANR